MDCQVASTKCCCGRGDAHEVSSAPACKGAPAAATHNLQRQQQYVLAGFGLFLMLPPPPPLFPNDVLVLGAYIFPLCSTAAGTRAFI